MQRGRTRQDMPVQLTNKLEYLSDCQKCNEIKSNAIIVLAKVEHSFQSSLLLQLSYHCHHSDHRHHVSTVFFLLLFFLLLYYLGLLHLSLSS